MGDNRLRAACWFIMDVVLETAVSVSTQEHARPILYHLGLALDTYGLSSRSRIFPRAAVYLAVHLAFLLFLIEETQDDDSSLSTF